jgi:hypothetical protein
MQFEVHQHSSSEHFCSDTSGKTRTETGQESYSHDKSAKTSVLSCLGDDVFSLLFPKIGCKNGVMENMISISAGPRLRSAIVVAIVADLLQIAIFPLFVEGAVSPADDILDLGIGAVLIRLLGWHWEFLPSFLGKLVPGVDMAPFWTLSVWNVYRKSRRYAVNAELRTREGQHPSD